MKHIYPTASRWLIGVFGLLLLVGVAAPQTLRAQSYSLPATGNTSITACSGTLYDDGGSNGPYSAYASGTTTISPATAGSKVKLQFTSFLVETGYDAVYIYDGNSVNAPLIGTYNNSNQPGTVYGTSASGALTVRLTSDGVVHMSGFSATIECVTSVPPQARPDLAIQGASLSPLSVVAGGNLTANCSIYNLSGATAGSSNVGYYLSNNAVLDASDQLLGNSQGFSMAIGQSSSRFANFFLPANTAPGNYFVLFAADYLNDVNESNENNNVVPVNITVTPSSIDLLVLGASVTPLNTAAGSPINMGCSIVNQGNAMANSSSVGFYFSRNATLDASDQLLTSQYGGQLTPPFSSSRFGTAAVPLGITPGTYYILFVADYQNQVNETNEANNVTAVSITVAPPGVDLVIQQEQLFPNTTVAGNSVQVNASIVNQGNITASSSTVGFYLSTNQSFDASDVLLGTGLGGSLTANQGSYRSAYPMVPLGTAPGNYFVLYVADPQNNVAEVNETNNVRSLPLTVLIPSIDLVVQSSYIAPTATTAGGTTAASCYLYNQGNAMASPATVGYYLSTNQVLDASDVLLGNTTGTVSGSNYSSRFVNLTVPAGTAVGNYFVLFVADHQNQIAETNENNNVAIVPLQVITPGIDLLVQQANLGATGVTPGFPIAAVCFVQNAGNTIAPSSTVGYYLSTNQVLDAGDVLLSTEVGFAIGAGQNNRRFASLTVPAGTAAGSYHVLFVVDPQNAVSETNENNNLATQPLTVLGPFTGTLVPFSGATTVTTCGTTIYDNGGYSDYADNSNGSLTILPATPGAMIQLVFNSFQMESGFDNVRVYDGTSTNAPLLGVYTGNQLPPLLLASNIDGALTVQFTSDGSVTASGFDATVSCGVAPQSDLVLTQIGASPSALRAGANLVLSAAVANQGAGPAASAAVGYYLSTNQVLDASDRLLGISPGAALGTTLSSTRQLVAAVPSNVSAGPYYVLFVADPLNVVSESNENNNMAALAVTVAQPLASRDQTAGYTITIAPNPVGGGNALRVALGGAGAGATSVASLDLYNALGQRVRSQPLTLSAGRTNQAEIPTQGLAMGVYSLRITGPGLSVTRRVVVE